MQISHLSNWAPPLYEPSGATENPPSQEEAPFFFGREISQNCFGGLIVDETKNTAEALKAAFSGGLGSLSNSM